MKKVILVLAEGFEEVEALTPVDILRRANIEVTTMSITDKKLVTGAHGISVESDILFAQADFSSYDALILPGGMPGTNNLNNHRGLKKAIINFSENNKLIGAICAAPLVLGELDLLKGRKAVCYPGFEKHLRGATLIKVPVVMDGNFITANGIGSAMRFSLALVKELTDENTVNFLKEKMLVD